MDSVSEDNMFEELKTTRSTSWQFELRQMQRTNKKLVEELNQLVASKKKRKRRKGVDQLERDCANCHTKVTPEWRRGPSGKRDLCNSCGLRFAKLVGYPLLMELCLAPVANVCSKSTDEVHRVQRPQRILAEKAQCNRRR